MQMMKSVRFHSQGAPDVLVYEDVPKPQAQAGEVLVHVEVAGVNFADVVRRRGDPYPQPSPLPYSLGGEAIGIVEATGSPADQHWIGKRVFAFPGKGCYSEYVVAPQNLLFPVPEGIDSVQGIALFVQGLSAALILKAAGRLQSGEAVLVQGAAGGVGLLAVQLAKLYGASLVIGAVSTAEKRQLIIDHGANVAVDYTSATWADEVRSATQGRGVDLVLEMTGGEIARTSMKLLAPFGRSIVYGTASQQPLIVNTEDLPGGNYSVGGFYLRPYLFRRELILGLLEELGNYVKSSQLKIHVGGIFALSQAAQAHQLLESRGTSGKIVLKAQC